MVFRVREDESGNRGNRETGNEVQLKFDFSFLREHPEGGPGSPGGPAAAGIGAVRGAAVGRRAGHSSERERRLAAGDEPGAGQEAEVLEESSW